MQLVDTVVGRDSVIRQTVAFESRARRPGHLRSLRVAAARHAGWATTRISGTYVEVKNSEIGAGAKVPHLSYVGDADIGEGTNIGAGNITANYDGRRKHRTKIGKDVRSGSNTVFVAPVEVGDGAYTGAGAVVNRDVPPGAMAKGVPARIEEDWVAKRDNDDADNGENPEGE